MYHAKHDARTVEQIDCVFIPQYVIDTEKAAKKHEKAMKKWGKAASKIIDNHNKLYDR